MTSIIFFFLNFLCLTAGFGEHHKLVVIGGGAAGVFGAISACERARELGLSLDTVVFEQGSEAMTKVRISGGGRCNVMHDETLATKDMVSNYPRGSRELLGVMTSRFGAKKTAAWFRKHGVDLKVENDGRMFPVSDESQTIIQCLLKQAKKLGIKILTRAKVLSITPNNRVKMDISNSKFSKSFKPLSPRFTLSIRTSKKPQSKKHPLVLNEEEEVTNKDNSPVQTTQYEKHEVCCDAVLACPGGSREVWRWLATLGHEIEKPVPSLFTLKLKQCQLPPPSPSSLSNHWLHDLAGISLTDTTLTLFQGKDKVTTNGPLLITHSGISGPAALRLSAFAAGELSETQYKAVVSINWLGINPTTPFKAQHDKVVSALKKFRSPTTTRPKLNHHQHQTLDLRSKLVSTFFPLTKLDLMFTSITLHNEKKNKTVNGIDDEFINNELAQYEKNNQFGDEHYSDEHMKLRANSVLPQRLWNAMLQHLRIPNTLRWNSISDEQILRIATALLNSTVEMVESVISYFASITNQRVVLFHAFFFIMTGRGLYKDEFVTCGGVSLKEVDFKRLESKVVPGLYFAGEVLDIDGVTGGFNFQSCWTTGYVAGYAIANSAAEKT